MMHSRAVNLGSTAVYSLLLVDIFLVCAATACVLVCRWAV